MSFLISNVAISFFIGPILALGYVSILYSIICQFILTVSTNIFSKNAIVVIIFSKCFSYIAYVMRAIETIGIKIVFAIAKICAKLPFSKIYFTTPKFVLILLYYGILLGIVWYVRKYTLRIFIFLFRINRKKHEKSIIYSKDKKKYHKRKISNIHKSINNISTNISINRSIYKNISRIIIVIGIGTIGLCTWLHFHETLMIYFVDVGQGDCTVITTPKGKNIVIDGGEGNSDQYDYGKNVVVPYLLDRGIKQIDYLIVSHCDSDHIGGLLAVLKTLKVEKIFIGKQPENSKQLQDMLAVAHQKNIEIISLEANMHVNIEKDMYIHVLWPNSSNMITENALNNNSLVFKLCYQNISCMFTGDIEEIAEKEILRTYQNQPTILKAEILKVAHHGSKTSTTNDFLYTVQPKVALIGVGERQSIWTSFKRSNRQIAYAKNKDISHRYNGRNHFVHSGTLVNGTFCPFYYVC